MAKINNNDDNESFLELFRTLRSGEDFDVITLNLAMKALEKLGAETPNLFISDVRMPDMTGLEFFSTVEDSHPDIPFIMLTAFGSTEKVFQAVKKGAFHYFEKPHNNLNRESYWITFRRFWNCGARSGRSPPWQTANRTCWKEYRPSQGVDWAQACAARNAAVHTITVPIHGGRKTMKTRQKKSKAKKTFRVISKGEHKVQKKCLLCCWVAGPNSRH